MCYASSTLRLWTCSRLVERSSTKGGGDLEGMEAQTATDGTGSTCESANNGRQTQ